jgi:ATP-dependent DNA helicase RecQ
MTATAEKDVLVENLQKYFGFDNFKASQRPIIESVMAGKDTFAIMPTGGGKSLCYQLPALMLPGVAIIISPLIALMKNQVDNIRSYSDIDDIAHFLNSSLTKVQMRKVKQDIVDGKTKLLFVAPETLTKEENIEFFQSCNVSLVAVDEAHCISEWGHDFRPEYRRIRAMLDAVAKNVPIVALTATATPKVRQDIVKNLDMSEDNTFISSFNRDNLFYEIRPKLKKEQTMKQIIQIIKESFRGESGIIYVQNRKTAEDIASALNVNDIKAAPYHAGLDPKTRTAAQDGFLMEKIDVICATIAFGMGIDKPDVRFVMHYDMPKSIENYYQETGRAGRDGMAGRCIAFYAYSDLLRLEKFLRDKPVSEREMGAQLLQEVTAYAESGACRRKFLLHYFGEEFEDSRCQKMCDNCRNPKERIEAKEEMHNLLECIQDINENYLQKVIVEYVSGKETTEMKDFRFNQRELFGIGKDRDDSFWNSMMRNALIMNFIQKEVEEFGVVKLTDAGREFIKKPHSVSIVINHSYEDVDTDLDDEKGGTAVLDDLLLNMLKDLRRRIATKNDLPPYVIFQDPSIEEMATNYPITMEDMAKISGVSAGKAQRYGKEFVELIVAYVEEHEIDRPMEITIKTVANKSKTKVDIIKSIDMKLTFEEIMSTTGLSHEELLQELYAIISSGTKLRMDYYLNEKVNDEWVRNTIIEYFKTAKTDDVDTAVDALKEDDIIYEEIELMRLKFLSDWAN